jgi:hypothetical protein
LAVPSVAHSLISFECGKNIRCRILFYNYSFTDHKSRYD